MADLDMKISGELVRDILDSKIQAAIVAELGKAPELISAAVNTLMTLKVDENGKVNSYSSYNKFGLVEGLTRKAIRDAVESAIREWVAEQHDSIKEQVAAELRRKAKGLASCMVTGLGESLKGKNSWKMNVACEFRDAER